MCFPFTKVKGAKACLTQNIDRSHRFTEARCASIISWEDKVVTIRHSFETLDLSCAFHLESNDNVLILHNRYESAGRRSLTKQ